MSEEKLLKATHQGFIHIGNNKIRCVVLEDGTRVLSEREMAKALGASRSGSLHSQRQKQTEHGDFTGTELPIFLTSKTLKPFISEDLAVAPIYFTNLTGKTRSKGFNATLLPKACEIWLKARDAGALNARQLRLAVSAEIVLRALAQVGIVALIDEATGYQIEREKDALQQLLSIYLSEERLKWAKTFPDEYYKQLFRLKGWAYNPIDVRRPKIVGKLTNQLVYEKLPPNVIDELKRLNPVKNKKTGRRAATHHQYLSEEVGQKDLRDHLLQLIAIMRISPNWGAFLRNFARAFPGPIEQIELALSEDEN